MPASAWEAPSQSATMSPPISAEASSPRDCFQEAAALDIEQLALDTARRSYAEIDEEAGIGGYGEWTEIELVSTGYDALEAALAQRNELVAARAVERVHDHVTNPDLSAISEARAWDEMLGGVETDVEAPDFVNYLSAGVVTRADTALTCILEARGAEDEGWGNRLSFTSHVYDSQTGEELALEDLVADTSLLPDLVSEALHRKYILEDMFEEEEDAAAIVRGKLENPAEHGELAWTADYLGMRFYFGSDDFAHADTYHGMYVSLPYHENPDLFAPICQALPEDFVAQIEYGVAYELPGDAQARAVCITRAHNDNVEGNWGWTFRVAVGTVDDGAFEQTGEALYSCWFYDICRQDYTPSLVCADGRYCVYGFGDRDSGSLHTSVFSIQDDGIALVRESREGLWSGVPYTVWAFPSNPAQVTLAATDCLASYDRIVFERTAALVGDGTTEPEASSYAAHTVNECYATRIEVGGFLLSDDGSVGEATVIPAGSICYLAGGAAYDHYDMRLEDGRLVRLEYDPQHYEIDGHYTRDIFVIVPTAAAESCVTPIGPRERLVWVHGREVPLVPETGNITGAGAIIDYGDSVWWIEEEFVGTFVQVDALPSFFGGNLITTTLTIREDGTFSFTVAANGLEDAYEGVLSATRGWGVYASGEMRPADGSGYARQVWLDYADAGDGEDYSVVEFFSEQLPYPMSEQTPPYHCYLTR